MPHAPDRMYLKVTGILCIIDNALLLLGDVPIMAAGDIRRGQHGR